MRPTLALALFACFAQACGSSDDSDSFQRETARPYITIGVAPAGSELTPGDTVRLQITLLRDDGSGDPVAGTFSSNNETVATVDQNSGVVTAVAKGTTSIRAQYGPGNAYASITVK